MTKFKYKRGDLLQDVQIPGWCYRVERLLEDQDTGSRFYMVRQVNVSIPESITLPAGLAENPACFVAPVPTTH